MIKEISALKEEIEIKNKQIIDAAYQKKLMVPRFETEKEALELRGRISELEKYVHKANSVIKFYYDFDLFASFTKMEINYDIKLLIQSTFKPLGKYGKLNS